MSWYLFTVMQARENDTILFTTGTEERENSEWGIRAWIPDPFVPVLIGQERC